MMLASIDAEKLIFTKANVGSEDIVLKVTGTNAKLDKLAYVVS